MYLHIGLFGEKLIRGFVITKVNVLKVRSTYESCIMKRIESKFPDQFSFAMIKIWNIYTYYNEAYDFVFFEKLLRQLGDFEDWGKNQLRQHILVHAHTTPIYHQSASPEFQIVPTIFAIENSKKLR